jgi:hypothetical protein
MYLGRVYLIDGLDPYKIEYEPNYGGQHFNPARESITVKEVLAAARNGLLALMPAYEFMADMRRVPVKGPDGRVMMDGQMPMTGLAREPVTAGPDFLLHQTPIHLLHVDNIYFFSQMNSADVTTYWTFIDAAEERNKQIRLEMSGLVGPNEPVRHGPRL